MKKSEGCIDGRMSGEPKNVDTEDDVKLCSFVPTEASAQLRNFTFACGEVLPTLRIHYRTLGSPSYDANGVVRNAVLIAHGTGGHGGQLLGKQFGGELFHPGGILDARQYFIILPDAIGHGKSSKPSDEMGIRFPAYRLADMVNAQYRLLTEHIHINHLRLIIGISMGGAQAWAWGIEYPHFMDALLPLGTIPAQISGLNRIWRRAAIDAIRNDPQWQSGCYRRQPQSLRTAWQIFYLMVGSTLGRQMVGQTQSLTDIALDSYVDNGVRTSDANDLLRQLEALDGYHPAPALHRIKAVVLAINAMSDLICPANLGIIEKEVRCLKNGRFILIDGESAMWGHSAYVIAKLWKHHLPKLMIESATPF